MSQMIEYVRRLFGNKQSQSSALTRTNEASRALTYFDGAAPDPLTTRTGQVNDNVKINYASVVVEKGVAFLFGAPLQISIGTDEDKSGEEYVETVWASAQRDEDFMDLATDGAISGDAYLKISIQGDGRPRVSVLDPATMQIETDPHDVSRVIGFRCEYKMVDSDVNAGKPFLFREETVLSESETSWQIAQYHSYNEGKTFLRMGEIITWNFEFAPIFHCKNLPAPKQALGRPDLTPDVLRLIGAISRLDSLCARVVRAHSAPKPYAVGLRKQDVELATDEMMFLPQVGQGTQASVGLLEMKGDLQGALALRKVLREGLAEVTRVPEVASGKVENTGSLSGVALRVLYSPLLDKTATKQRLYGRMIKEVIQALLIIGGKGALSVELHWADPLPANEVEAVQVAEGKKRLGFSDETLISQLGGDPQAEREKRVLNIQDLGTSLLGAFDRGALPPAGAKGLLPE